MPALDAADALGLTTQVPVRSVDLTSGRSRTMNLGRQVVERRHSPRGPLALAKRPVAWLGPDMAEAALKLRRPLRAASASFGEECLGGLGDCHRWQGSTLSTPYRLLPGAQPPRQLVTLDPFSDFDTRGYLRDLFSEKDPEGARLTNYTLDVQRTAI